MKIQLKDYMSSIDRFHKMNKDGGKNERNKREQEK